MQSRRSPITTPTFFATEKEQWKKEFLIKMEEYLFDEDKLAIAFNVRVSLNKLNTESGQYQSHTQFDANELNVALDELDAENTVNYQQHDIDRTGTALLMAGYTLEDIEAMKLSDVLKYEAAIFAAHGDIAELQHIPYLTLYQLDLYKDTPQIILEDQKDFENTLTKLAKPLLEQHQADQAYLNLEKTLSDESLDENLRTKGKLALEEIQKLRKSQGVALPELTVSLNIINKTIIKPSKNNAIDCRKQAKRLGSYAWGTILGGIMMTLAGATMALISGVLTAASIASTPISGPLGIGGAVVSGGIGVMGLGAMAGGITLFAQGCKQTAETRAVRKAIQNVASLSEQISKTKDESENEPTIIRSRTSSICA